MRVLLVTHHFWPENFKVNDLIDGLLDKGHDVTILTGKPNYPEGKIYPEFRDNPQKFRKFRSAQIKRVPVIPRGSSRIQLFLNYLSFLFSLSLLGPFKTRKKKFDCILVFAVSPISVAIPAILISKLRKVPVLLWVLDLWPETLMALGFKSKGLLGFISHVVNFIYKQAAIILVPSKGAVKKIKDDYNLQNNVFFFWNFKLPKRN